MSVACREPESKPGNIHWKKNFVEDEPSSGKRLWASLKLTLFIILVGLAIFVHGCHGDEDNELFTSAGFFSASPGDLLDN